MAANCVGLAFAHTTKTLQVHNLPSAIHASGDGAARTGKGSAVGTAYGSGGKGFVSETYHMSGIDNSQCTTNTGDKAFNSHYSVDDGEEATGPIEQAASQASARLPQSVMMLLSSTANLWEDGEMKDPRATAARNSFKDKKDMKDNTGSGTVVLSNSVSLWQDDETDEPHAVVEPNSFNYEKDKHDSSAAKQLFKEVAPTRVLKCVRVKNLQVSGMKLTASLPTSACHSGFGSSSSDQAYTMLGSSKFTEAASAPESFRPPPGLQHPSEEGEAVGIDAGAYESEIDEPDSDLEDEPTTVLVGPSPLASAPYSLKQVAIPDPALQQKVFIKSSVGQMALSDAFRLMAGGNGVPLSFGSAAHLAHGELPSCRPCMYERWAGRCAKKWLCDFCHLHVGNRRKGKTGASANSRRNPSNSFSPLVSQAGPDDLTAGIPLRQRL